MSDTVRVVLYARVSKDDRGSDRRNLAGQIEMCQEYALSNGYQIVEELTEDDRGTSGALFDLPQLNRSLTMTRNGEIDVLIVREFDRFARSLAKQLIVESEFKAARVTIEYVLCEYSDTPEGNLMKNVRAVVAEYERLNINERMTRGRRQKVKAGNVMPHGRAPYGYDIVKNGNDWAFEINESEAQVVRLIFGLYTVGDGGNGTLNLMEVTNKLSEMGIPTYADTHRCIRGKKRKRGEWSRSTVFRMLKNETCIGVWHYGKNLRVEGRWTRNPEEHLITVSVPPIVTRDVWEAAQKRMKQNKLAASRNVKRYYLVSRRMTCGLCNNKMVGKSKIIKGKLYSYYVCSATNRSRGYVHRCGMPYFHSRQVDTLIWSWVKELIAAPEELKDGVEDYKATCEEENAPMRERLTVFDDLLEENQQQLERLLDLYLNGDFSKDLLEDEKERLEETIQALDLERDKVATFLEVNSLTEEQEQNLHAFAARIREELDFADNDFEAQRHIIETLNVMVTLTFEDDQKVVYVYSDFGESVFPVLSNTT